MADEERTQVEEPEVEVSDEEAADDVIVDAETKTYTEEQFGGLLRDKQAESTARQTAQAEVAALKQHNEQLAKELEESQKSETTELTEEESLMGVTRGEFQTTLKNFSDNLKKDITGIIGEQTQKDKTSNLQKLQAKDGQALVVTHTVKTKGQGLDANSVVNEAIPWLRVNKPHLLKAAMESEQCANEIYELGIALVPSIKTRFETRQNTLIATKLDQSGNAPSMGSNATRPTEEVNLLMQIMDPNKSDADLDKLAGL